MPWAKMALSQNGYGAMVLVSVSMNGRIECKALALALADDPRQQIETRGAKFDICNRRVISPLLMVSSMESGQFAPAG